MISKRGTANRDRAILLVLLDGGIPRQRTMSPAGEERLDQKQGRLHIRKGKGSKGRFVYLGEAARKALWRYLASRQAPPDAPLFVTWRGNHMDRNTLRDMIVHCAEHAGVTDANVHRWRHTFAINYLRNGGNVLELQRLMGHERTDTLQI